VFANSPTLVSPALGAATATSINGVTVTGTGTPALSVTGTTAVSGTNTGDQTITLTGGVTGSGTGSFAATVVTNANLTGAITSTGNATSLGSFSSANLASALTDETGSGANVFANSPTLVTPNLGAASATSITNGLGAVGTPSYTFTGDTNTGIFSPAADTIAFVHGGAEAMRINSAGNVGIGVTSPTAKLDVAGNAIISTTDNTNAALRITQLGTGNAILVEDSANPDASPFVINRFGQVSVGALTSTPSYWGSPAFNVMATESTDFKPEAVVASYHTTSSYGGMLTLSRSKSGTAGTAGSILASGDAIGRLGFNGDDGVGLRITAASIGAFVDGTPGTNDMPGRLVFGTTADGASSPTERMRIDSSGNVGIGTTNPAEKLAVNGNVAVTGTVSATSGYNGTVGATTPSTGAFTTIGASNDVTVSGAVALAYRLTRGAVQGIWQNGATQSFFGTASAHNTEILVNNSVVGAFSSTGLAITGALSATGANNTIQARFEGATGKLRVVGYADATTGAFLQAINAAENSYTVPLTLDGSSIRVQAQGSTVGSFTTTGLAVTGALSCTGALAIGNTVNTVSPTSPNRTVTIVIGGTTYYLAAKTTND
jgi:hypothetical protein